MTPHAALPNRLKSHAHDEANNFDWYNLICTILQVWELSSQYRD
ncbi:hypothetical protein V5J35_001214 [Endozoicomonas sp. NE40]|uniref:Uncharacterized protein n=1 Tax=Endozoicomonas lisbonensis TaxID=3120522 RepID=A0ABV2SE31_9GAMM